MRKRKEKTTQAVQTLPTSIKEKRIPRAGAPCIPFTKRNKRRKSMGIRRVTSSSPCLILVTRVEKGLLKSASGASKFISVLDGIGMKLQSKPGGCMSVKAMLFKRLQDIAPAVLLLGGFRLILGPGVLAVFDLNKMDASQFWKELARVTDIGGKWNHCGWL
eukprot:1158838-Pelagomonas_calceolata.AAC.11